MELSVALCALCHQVTMNFDLDDYKKFVWSKYGNWTCECMMWLVRALEKNDPLNSVADEMKRNNMHETNFSTRFFMAYLILSGQEAKFRDLFPELLGKTQCAIDIIIRQYNGEDVTLIGSGVEF